MNSSSSKPEVVKKSVVKKAIKEKLEKPVIKKATKKVATKKIDSKLPKIQEKLEKPVIKKATKKVATKKIDNKLPKIQEKLEKSEKLAVHVTEEKLEEKNFRLNAKGFFLTYPQQKGIDEHIIKEELTKIVGDVHSLIIGKEKGDSIEGYDHFHVILETKTKKNYKDPRCFDIRTVHGKYETLKNKKKALKYVSKEGNVLSEGIDLNNCLLSTFKVPFERFMFKCRYLGHNPSDVLKKSKQNAAYNQDSFQIYNDYLASPSKYDRYIVDFRKAVVIPPKRLWIHKLKMDEFMRWGKQIVEDGYIRRSLYIHGRSGIGKTNLARLMFDDKVCIVKHLDRLKEVDVNSFSAIAFDDMNFSTSQYTREDCLNIIDAEVGSQINVKNTMVSLEACIPKVFISNFEPSRVYRDYDEAVARRLHAIFLDSDSSCAKSIYHSEKEIPEQSKSDYVEMHSSTFNYLIEWVSGRRGI